MLLTIAIGSALLNVSILGELNTMQTDVQYIKRGSKKYAE